MRTANSPFLAGLGDTSKVVAPSYGAAAPAVRSKDGAELFPVLDGIRVIMTVWVVIFHCMWHVAMFMTKDQFNAYWERPSWIWKLGTNGLAAVDIFFILTGFLLAQPLFTGQRAGSWGSFVWRRLTRVYPAFITTIIVFCLVLHNMAREPYLPWSKHASNGVRDLVIAANGVAGDGVPNNCQLIPINLMFLSNFVPFGGCLGWTWSLSIQVQFYVLFPILIKIFGMGKGLFRFLLVCFFAQIVFRYVLYTNVVMQYAPPELYMFEFEHKDMFFVFFNIWYSSTPQRMICIFMGVMMAYVHVHVPQVKEFLQNNRIIHSVLTLLTIPTIYHTFVMSSLNPVLMTLFTVGGPIWLLSCAFLLFSCLHGLGFWGPVAKWFLSLPIFGTLATPTYSVYLIHSALIVKVYSWMYPLHPGFTDEKLLLASVVVLIASWTFGVLVHYIVEEPIKNYLRGRTSSGSSSGSGGATGSRDGSSSSSQVDSVHLVNSEALRSAGISPVVRPRLAAPSNIITPLRLKSPMKSDADGSMNRPVHRLL